MEFNEPTIRESLDSFKQDDVDSIAVVPLFLARGVHIDEDIPGILGLAPGQKKGLFFTVKKKFLLSMQIRLDPTRSWQIL